MVKKTYGLVVMTITIQDFIPTDIPKDVVQVDILYKNVEMFILVVSYCFFSSTMILLD